MVTLKLPLFVYHSNMEKIREVIAYKNYFVDFLTKQPNIMKAENKNKDISTWSQIKDQVYGEKGTERLDNLERETESFKIGLLLKKARESRHMTQEELGQLIDKKRTYISRVENDGSNITLSTLFDIVENGLGGKVSISIDV